MKPFRDIDLRQSIEAIKSKIKNKIDSYTNDEIIANNLELLADNIYEEFYIPPVLIYDEDSSKRSVEQKKIIKRLTPFYTYDNEYKEVEVDGIVMTFYYPFTGERDLFKCHASTYSLSGYPEINIEKDYFSLSYEKPLNEVKNEQAKKDVYIKLNNDMKSIRDGIGYANADAESFNSNLRSYALDLLSDKKKKIETFFSVAAMFEVPVKKNEYSMTHISVQRNITPIAHKYNKQNSYYISESDYNDILDAIKHTCSTYERTASSYKMMREEDLRNTLLATLNATYKGNANGEAFRNRGKTDICIESENRAAFVAECKIWAGQNEIEMAIKQLDGYLTWRDCKTALIYFVRNKNFFNTLDIAERTLKDITVIRQVHVVDKNEFECSMVSESNIGQIVKMRVMLFNLYYK